MLFQKNFVNYKFVIDLFFVKLYIDFRQRRNFMIAIAVDGHSGSGKGELSRGLAKRFNLKHLDTGAILRAMGLYFYRNQILNPTSTDVEKHYEKLNIKIEFEGNMQKTILNGEDVSSDIRVEHIGQMASKVAVIEKAMRKMIDISQEFAKNYDCILDGRNITSEVLPNADVKFFLDASPECRAKRRLADEQKKNPNATFEEILNSLVERDYRDVHRDFSPMILTKDSVLVDNSTMTIDETINYCASIAEKKLKEKGKI